MNTSIALTISPPIRSIYTKLINPYNFVYEQDCILIKQILHKDRIYGFIIYPEFDSKGRLHYHGILNLDTNQYIRFYKRSLHKLKSIGFVDIKKLQTFNDKLRWILYIKKEWGISKNILEIEAPLLSNRKTLKLLKVEKDNYLDQISNLSKTIFYYLIQENATDNEP